MIIRDHGSPSKKCLGHKEDVRKKRMPLQNDSDVTIHMRYASRREVKMSEFANAQPKGAPTPLNPIESALTLQI